MIRLYARPDGVLHYWEAFEAEDQLVRLHRGRVGTPGETCDIRVGSSSAQAIMDREADAMRAQGYSEWSRDPVQIVIQRRTEDSFGDLDDLDLRHQIEDLMTDEVVWNGIGECDGGDIGSGTINVLLNVIDGDLAVAGVITALRKADLLQGCTIAIDAGDGFRVVWPEGFKGDFSVL